MIRRLSSLFAFLLCAAPVSAQEKAEPQPAKVEPVKLEAISGSFELWQDGQGFLWQLGREGALGSAEASYFHEAMALYVKGAPFAPTHGVRADGGQPDDAGARISLGQQVGSLRITRDVWFDRGRSGVRVLDSFDNTGSRRESIRVELKTAFQNPWQDLHGSQGRILGDTTATGKLGDRDFGVVVKFSPSEGRHDTLFVTSGEADALRPAISFSSNLREIVFSYDLDIEPGRSAALVHWIAQRNLQTPAAAVEALRPFYQRRQLIDPGVLPATATTVRKFDAQSFPSELDRPAAVEGLASLNAALEPLGLARRGDDLLWITGENQLAGTANPAATLAVATARGEMRATLAEIAAIQGGGGVGRVPRVFLRDGRVWAGRVTATNLSMKTAEGWEVEEMRPEELSLLLLRVGKTDGQAPEGASLFVETRDGDVLAVSEASAKGAALKLLTPWGETSAPLSDIAELYYAGGPGSPRFRVLRREGSLGTAFFGGGDLSLVEPVKGDPAPITLSPLAIAAVWRAGAKPGHARGDLADEWFDLDDARAALGTVLPDPAVLLAGNNVMRATLAMESLSLVADATVTPIDPEEVIAIRQSIDSDPAAVLYEVELVGGQTLTGRLREPNLTLREGEKLWTVPAAHFIAFERTGAAAPKVPAKP